MANLLQSSQNKTTTAPSFYTDYLSNLATAGKTAQQGAEFVGAQPLQTKAFEAVCQNFGNAQPAFATGQGYVGQAAGQDVTGAASPFLAAGTSTSPLSALQPYAQSAMSSTGLGAASPYLQTATGTSPADLAAEYMNPYLKTAVQSLSDIAQRNIRQNLTPQATAAAVGSGQFGSQRGAQVLGQVQAQANQDLNAQIAQMMSQGYGQALCAAGKQNALTAQAGQTAGALQQGQNQIAAGLGSTASQAQAQQNQANLTAAQTAAQAAANEGNLLNQAGQNMGTLGSQASAANLACINALSTLGGQQQTIGQNEQNFPLSTLSSLSGLLQGYNIPVGTRTTLCASPLSVVAGGVSGGTGLYDKSPSFQKLVDKSFSGLGKILGSSTNLGGGISMNSDGSISGGSPNIDSGMSNQDIEDLINGGPEQLGGDNYNYFSDEDPNGDLIELGNCFYNAKGGAIRAKAGGSIGCASTKFRGALPYKKG